MKDALGNHVRIVAVRVDLFYPDDPKETTLEGVPLICLAARPGQLCRAICRLVRREGGGNDHRS